MWGVAKGPSRSYKEINQHTSLPWNFITHGFLDPSAFPDNVVPKMAPVFVA